MTLLYSYEPLTRYVHEIYRKFPHVSILYTTNGSFNENTVSANNVDYFLYAGKNNEPYISNEIIGFLGNTIVNIEECIIGSGVLNIDLLLDIISKTIMT